jgi:hypothetical protein
LVSEIVVDVIGDTIERRFGRETQIDRGVPLWELVCLVFDKVSWSDIAAAHNRLVAGSSPTSSTIQSPANRRIRTCSECPILQRPNQVNPSDDTGFALSNTPVEGDRVGGH